RGLETGPAAWDSRAEEQAVATQPEAEDVFDDRSKHPAAGACVPGPAATSRIGRLRIDVTAGNVGLDAIALRFGTRARVVDGIDHREQIACAVAVAHDRERDDAPQH